MQLVIKINLTNGASDDDGMQLAENIIDSLNEYSPEENGACDTRACIQDVSYRVEKES